MQFKCVVSEKHFINFLHLLVEFHNFEGKTGDVDVLLLMFITWSHWTFPLRCRGKVWVFPRRLLRTLRHQWKLVRRMSFIKFAFTHFLMKCKFFVLSLRKYFWKSKIRFFNQNMRVWKKLYGAKLFIRWRSANLNSRNFW